MTKWSVLIAGLGLRVVMSKDIDGAYLAAMKEYGCKIEDILAVFCHSPFNPSMMSRSVGKKSEDGEERQMP